GFGPGPAAENRVSPVRTNLIFARGAGRSAEILQPPASSRYNHRQVFPAFPGILSRAAMRETESVKGSSYALTVAMSGETIIDFAQELRDAKTALARWHKTRKEKCGSVLLSIVAPVANHPEIERILQRIYQDADEPGPLLRKVRAEVALHNDREKSVKQFVL